MWCTSFVSFRYTAHSGRSRPRFLCWLLPARATRGYHDEAERTRACRQRRRHRRPAHVCTLSHCPWLDRGRLVPRIGCPSVPHGALSMPGWRVGRAPASGARCGARARCRGGVCWGERQAGGPRARAAGGAPPTGGCGACMRHPSRGRPRGGCRTGHALGCTRRAAGARCRFTRASCRRPKPSAGERLEGSRMPWRGVA